MFLSKLQILGFKSFPQKTELHLDRGVICIVGPNGCGKTNLLDAIRWVLGEQRTTLLRSSKMEDVIFNGSKDLKPLGMAEVSLVIDNNQGILPIDYNQVTVTRRLFRSGESEYLLNKNQCRLKDITELFLDTGVGIHAYSVIQTEMVEAILSDRADERRFMFEEAAGITKYKLRKKEAERKLEHTENDLLRLGDILSEVEKQVNSLARQKGKAERYKKLTEQIRDKEIRLSRSEFQTLKTREKELQEKLAASADLSQKATSGLDKEEAEVENLKLRLLETEKQTGLIQKAISEFSEKNFQIEREISINRERKANLEKLIQRNQEESKNLEARLSTITDEKEQKKSQVDQLTVEIDSKKKECDAEEAKLLDGDEKLQQIKNRLQELSRDWQEANDNLNRRTSEKENTIVQIEELKKQENSLDEEKQVLEGKINELTQKLEGLSSQDEEKRKLREVKTNEIQELKENIEHNKTEISKLSAEENSLRSLLEGEKARLHMLHQISEHYEGYGKGEKWVLSTRDEHPGIVDTLANLITTTPEYVKAIESALGEAAQFIICQDTDSAKNAIQQLKEQKAGRATFLPMDKINALDVKSQQANLGGLPGIIGRASELVQCNRNTEKVTELLLGTVILVKTLDEALQLSSQMESGFDLVTLDGEVVKTQGALSGGSAREISLLGRELEIQKLSDQVKEKTEKLNGVISNLSEKQAEEGRLEHTLSQLISVAEEIGGQLQKSEIELKTVDFEKESLQKRSLKLEELGQKIKRSIEELADKSEEQGLQIVELADKKDMLSASMDEQRQILENEETAHTETFKNANRLKIELVSLQGRQQQVESEINRLAELIQEIENTKIDKLKESEDSRAEIESLTQNTSYREEELKQIFRQIEEQKTNLTTQTEEHSRWQEQLANKEKNLKAARQSREKVQDELHQLKMQQVELSSHQRSILDRVSEEYQVNLEEIEPEADLSSEERENLGKEIGQIKEKLRSIGAVNLLALEEYQTAKQRLDFLETQVKDLTEAKETLTSTIAKINDTARTLFTETFEKIRINFQKVFVELFEGGETDLRLEEADDPLESPVRISARPYGKKLLSISQLSGGEKALTAIALLFSIYLVKPSPFCILDEVDAPLDDANITRFLKLIRHFSSNTQFIIITHNKLTMEASDVLYGVTMEQPGVSKIVSVKFDKHELITEHNPDADQTNPSEEAVGDKSEGS